MQFLGNIEVKVDSKMRVFVPAAFRKVLHENNQIALILRKDIFQDCLVLYPCSVWEEEVQKLRSRLSRWDEQQQNLFRQFVMAVERLELDASGRILLPKRYLQMIGGGSEIQLLGVDNTIEIWGKGQLEQVAINAEEFGRQIQQIMIQGDE